MDVCCKAMKLSVAGVAAVGWLVLLGVTLHRVITDTHTQACAAASLFSAVLAITGTVVLAILHTIPSLFAAWSEGVEYGRRVEARQHTAVPAQGRRLTPVR